MVQKRKQELPIGKIVVGGCVALLIAYGAVNMIATRAAHKVAAVTIAPAAEKAAKRAVDRQVVEEQFVQFLVDNVKKETIRELSAEMKQIAQNTAGAVDVKYQQTTDTLQQDLRTLATKTDELVNTRVAAVEAANALTQKAVEESGKTMQEFVSLSLTDLVPAGAISAFYCTLDEPPRGWLICDGKTITADPDKRSHLAPNEKYVKLVRILTELGYGVEPGVATLPDLRGLFLRGVSEGVTVGQKQNDVIKQHRHPIYGEAQTVGVTSLFIDRGAKYRSFMTEIRGQNMPAPRPIFGDTEFQGYSTLDHADFVTDGADETRPKNVSVVWCIKY